MYIVNYSYYFLRYFNQAVFVLILFFVVSCDSTKFEYSFVDGRSIESFQEEIKEYPYVNLENQERWEENFKYLKLHFSLDELISFMGEPDIWVNSYVYNGKQRVFEASVLVYVLKEGLEEDEAINVYIHPEEGLFWIRPSRNLLKYALGEPKGGYWFYGNM